MKIALVRKRFVFHGGAERYVSSLVEELLKNNYSLTLFANSWEKKEQLKFIKVPLIKLTSFIKLVSFALFSFLKLKNYRFEVIHSFEKTCYQDIYRAGDGCHIEYLRKRWGCLSFFKKLLLIINPFHLSSILIEKIIFAKTKKIIAISKMGWEEIIRNYNIPEPKVSVIYNGVDFTKFKENENKEFRASIRKQYHISETDFVLLFIGSGFERKGLKFLLYSLPLIKEEPRKIKLLVAGKDKNMKKYTGLTKKLEIKDKVFFLGAEPEIEKVYAAGDLLIMPAIYEPFGNVCLEALASGVPVLVSKNCGAKEIVQENVNGLIIEDIYDSGTIAEKIAKIIQNYDTLKKNSRNSIKDYTLEKNSLETIKLYQEIVNAK